MSKLLNQAALVTAYALLSIAREPDFFLVDASVGVGGFGIGSSRAIVRDDGMEALTNPIVGAGIGTGGGVFAAFGWLWQLEKPSRDRIENFLSGAAGQVTFFKKVGLGYIRSPNSPTKNALLAGVGIGGKAAGVSFSRRRQQ